MLKKKKKNKYEKPCLKKITCQKTTKVSETIAASGGGSGSSGGGF